MAKHKPNKPVIPASQEPTPVAKRGILVLIESLFEKQDTATLVKEGVFVGTILGTMILSGAFNSCHIDKVATEQKVQTDSTIKIQTDTLKKQYRNWHRTDSILAAERFDSLVFLIKHNRK
jgi:hypothetical protein